MSRDNFLPIRRKKAVTAASSRYFLPIRSKNAVTTANSRPITSRKSSTYYVQGRNQLRLPTLFFLALLTMCVLGSVHALKHVAAK